jgi:hypothetical protein
MTRPVFSLSRGHADVLSDNLIRPVAAFLQNASAAMRSTAQLPGGRLAA